MHILKTLWFHRFCHKEAITDNALLDIVNDMEHGMINANLGGGIYKERLARQHEGKSGGFRLLLCYKHNERAIFIYGFPKSEKENITQVEKEDLKKLADVLLGVSDKELCQKLNAGAFMEITPDNSTVDNEWCYNA